MESTRKALDMDVGEYVRFQELKSLAVAKGTLTAEEGQLVYALLGKRIRRLEYQGLDQGDRGRQSVSLRLWREIGRVLCPQ